MTSDNAREELAREKARADRAEERILELAVLFNVPDGGRYFNDWKERAEKYHALRAAGYEKRTPAGEGAGVAEARPWRLLMHITYKSGSQRTERVVIGPAVQEGFMADLSERMTQAPEVRSWTVGREVAHGHKTFAEDLTPEAFERDVKALAARASHAPDADASGVEG